MTDGTDAILHLQREGQVAIQISVISRVVQISTSSTCLGFQGHVTTINVRVIKTTGLLGNKNLNEDFQSSSEARASRKRFGSIDQLMIDL